MALFKEEDVITQRIQLLTQLYQLDTSNKNELVEWCDRTMRAGFYENPFLSQEGKIMDLIKVAKEVDDIVLLARSVMESLFESQSLLIRDIESLNKKIRSLLNEKRLVGGRLSVEESAQLVTQRASEDLLNRSVPVSEVFFSTAGETFPAACLRELLNLVRKYTTFRLTDFRGQGGVVDSIGAEEMAEAIARAKAIADIQSRIGVPANNPFDRRDYLRRCPVCESVFVPNRADQVYCSYRDANRARKRRQRERSEENVPVNG